MPLAVASGCVGVGLCFVRLGALDKAITTLHQDQYPLNRDNNPTVLYLEALVKLAAGRQLKVDNTRQWLMSFPHWANLGLMLKTRGTKQQRVGAPNEASATLRAAQVQ